MAEGGGSGRHRWKRHIARQLRQRDRAQKALFADLVEACNKLLEKSSLSDLTVQSEDPSEDPQMGGPARRLASPAVEQLDEEGQRCQLQSQAEELGCRNSAQKAKDDSLQRCVQEQDGEFCPALESQGALQRRVVCTRCKSDRTERESEEVKVGEQKSASRNDPEEKEGGGKLFKRPCRQKRENSASRESEDRDCRVPSCVADERKAHISEINAITFSLDSSMLATGGSDGLIKLWNVAGGCLQQTQTLEGATGSISGLEFNPSGCLLLAATYNNAAQLWKVGGRRVKEILTGHADKVTAARFKHVWHQAVTGSRDRTVKVWDLAKMACFRTIQGFSYCNDVVCGDNVIVSGHHDKRIRFWDSRGPDCTEVICMEDKVTSLNLSSDQLQLLSCSRDDALRVIDLRMYAVRQVFRADGFRCGSDGTKAVLSPDKRYTLAGSVDGTIFLWNTKTGKLETSLAGVHRSSVNAVAWCPFGLHVGSVDQCRKVVLWR